MFTIKLGKQLANDRMYTKS